MKRTGLLKEVKVFFSDSCFFPPNENFDAPSGSFRNKQSGGWIVQMEDKSVPRLPVQSTVSPKVLAVDQSFAMRPPPLRSPSQGPAVATTTYTKLSSKSCRVEFEIKNIPVFETSASLVVMNHRQVEMEEMERKLMGMDSTSRVAAQGGRMQSTSQLRESRGSLLAGPSNLISC